MSTIEAIASLWLLLAFEQLVGTHCSHLAAVSSGSFGSASEELDKHIDSDWMMISLDPFVRFQATRRLFPVIVQSKNLSLSFFALSN